MPKIFFVEGNIGTGKSTFLSSIEKEYGDRFQVIYEPVDVWTQFKDSQGKNVLQFFYEDPKRYAYLFQNTAFVSRAQKLQCIDATKEAVFIERSVYSDRHIFAKNCFETGVMSEIEYALYLKWFDWLEALLSISNRNFIYLRASPEVSFSRMQIRGRSEEKGVSLEYIKAIHEKHEQWIHDLIQTENVCILNADLDLTDRSLFLENFQHSVFL